MSDSLTLTASFSQDLLPAHAPARVLYALLEIAPVEAAAPAPPLPLNLAIVVDKSDSMLVPILSPKQFQDMARTGGVREVLVDGVPVWQFEKMANNVRLNAPCSFDFVKQALRTAIEKLEPQDQIAVVVFARQAQVLIPQQSGAHKRALLKTLEQIDALQLGSETYMANGLSAGHDQLKPGYSRERVNRLVVLTDGFAQDGAQCQALARDAARAGIAISTLGLGVEFNEELLIALADASGGNAYFIREPAEIPAAFAREMNGAQNIVLRDLTLKMRFSAGVELRRVHRIKPFISDLGALTPVDRALNLALGDLVKHGTLVFLLELTAPPRADGTYRLAQMVLDYNDPARGVYGEKVRQDLVVRYAPAAKTAALDPRIMNLVEKVSAFRLQTRALEEARAGNIASATAKLKAAATRLISLGENDLAQAALQEAAQLEQTGQLSAVGTKRLRYDTRHLT